MKGSYNKNNIVGQSFQCATGRQDRARNRQSNTDRYTERCRGRQIDIDRHKGNIVLADIDCIDCVILVHRNREIDMDRQTI